MLLNLSQITQHSQTTKNLHLQPHQNIQTHSPLTTMHLSSMLVQNIFWLTRKQKQKQIVGIIYTTLTLSYTTKILGVISATTGFLTINLAAMFSRESFTMPQQIACGAVVQKTPINLVKSYNHKIFHPTIWPSNPMETYVGAKSLTTLHQCKPHSQINFASTAFLEILRSIVLQRIKYVAVGNNFFGQSATVVQQPRQSLMTVIV